jgi:molybdopterin converting factor small subunit
MSTLREDVSTVGGGRGRVMASGTVRFWAAARAAAGRAEQPYDAATLGDLVAALGAEHGPDLARVLGHCSFLVDGVRARPDLVLADGAEVEVLPPFAGG